MGRQRLALLHAPAHLAGDEPVRHGHDAAGDGEDEGEEVELVEAPQDEVGLVAHAPGGVVEEALHRHHRLLMKKRLISTEEEDTVEKPIISGIAFNRDEAKLTLMGVPDLPGVAH